MLDSGGDDVATQAMASMGPLVRRIRIPSLAFGHGTTRNLGCGLARGSLVAFLSQDAVPADEHWLSRLAGALRDDPRCAGAYSRQVASPEHPRWVQTRLQRDPVGSESPREQRACSADASPRERLAAVRFDNVASMIRREAWRAVPFPEVAFGEDVHWAARMIEKGHILRFVPGSRVVHSHHRGALDEFRRAFMTHRTLSRLVGLRTVPSLGRLATGLAAELVGPAPISGTASVFGQYLGGQPTGRG